MIYLRRSQLLTDPVPVQIHSPCRCKRKRQCLEKHIQKSRQRRQKQEGLGVPEKDADKQDRGKQGGENREL